MWARLINFAIGIWLMAAPAVLHSPRGAEINDRIVGPLAASAACIALWEITRPCRRANLVFGAWLAISPLFVPSSGADVLNSILCGVALAGFSFVAGRIRKRYGGGWKALWRPAAP